MSGSPPPRQEDSAASQPSSPDVHRDPFAAQLSSVSDVAHSPASIAEVSITTTDSSASIEASSAADSTAEVSRLLSAVITLNHNQDAGLRLPQMVRMVSDRVRGREMVPIGPGEYPAGSQHPATVPTSTQVDALTLLAQKYEGSLDDGCGHDTSSNASEIGSPAISPRDFHSDLASPRSSPASLSSSSHASAKLRAVSPGAEPFCINRLPLDVIARIVNMLEPFKWIQNGNPSVPGGPHSGSFNHEPRDECRENKKIYELLRWRYWFKKLRFNRMWANAVSTSSTWVIFIGELFGHQAMKAFFEPSRETMLQRAERVVSACCAAYLFGNGTSCRGLPLKLTGTAFLGPVWLCGIHRHVVDDLIPASPYYACHYCLLQQRIDADGHPNRKVMGTSDRHFAFVHGNVCDMCRSTVMYEEMLRIPFSWWWTVPERERDRNLFNRVLDFSPTVRMYVNEGEGTVSDTLDAVSQELWLEYHTNFTVLCDNALAKLRNEAQKALQKMQAKRKQDRVNFRLWTNSEGDMNDLIASEEEDDDDDDGLEEVEANLLRDPNNVWLDAAAHERCVEEAIRCWCWELLKQGLWTAPETCVELDDMDQTLGFSGLPYETTTVPLSSNAGRQRPSFHIGLDRASRIVKSALLVMPAFDMLGRVQETWDHLFWAVVSYGMASLGEQLKAEYGDQTSAIAAELSNDQVLELLRHRQLWQRPVKLRGGGIRMKGTTDLDDHVPMIPSCLADMPGKAARVFEDLWKAVRQDLTACDCQICRRAKRKRQEEAKEEKRKKTFRVEEQLHVVGVTLRG